MRKAQPFHKLEPQERLSRKKLTVYRYTYLSSKFRCYLYRI